MSIDWCPRISLAAIALLLLPVALASCRGSSASDPLEPYRNQKISWGDCDFLQFSQDDSTTPKKLAALGDRAQCWMMVAPLDYSDPSKGDLSVAFIRIAALPGGATPEPLLVNPGGPGLDGISMAIKLANLWTDASGTFAPVPRAFDLVGFSPRGTWSSTPLLRCEGAEPVPLYGNPGTSRDPASIQAMVRHGELIASACAADSLHSYIHTDAIARDMDLFREVSGRDRLNYFGGSYGTWLGLWYATLFPERVGRMVLNAVVDGVAGLEETYLGMARARQTVLDDVLAVYAAAHPDAFGLGTDVAGIRAVFPDLSPWVKYAVTLEFEFYHSSNAPLNVMTLVAAKGFQEILDANPQATEAELDALIATHRFAPPPGPFAEVARARASVIKAYYVYSLHRSPEPVKLDSQWSAYWAISCNDEPRSRTLADWIAQNDRDAALYPLWGGQMTVSPCFAWGANPVTRPPLARAATAGGILLLQTQRDGDTSLEGALGTLGALPNASMIEVVGDDYGHGVVPPYGKDCVDGPIVEYMMHGTLPVRRLECQGKELPPPGTLLGAPAAGPRELTGALDTERP